MSSELYIDAATSNKISHSKYVLWLNSLMDNYENGFWDSAVQNVIQLAFIQKSSSFLQELYQGEGRTLSGFMTVLPTDNTNFIVMIHSLGDGKPYLYNKTNGADLFEFQSSGFLTRFFENVTIDLFDGSANPTHECFITFEDWYGIKCPMYKIKHKGTNAIMGNGMLDVFYDGRYSGSYAVENKSLQTHTQYKVENISKMEIVTDVPILKNFSIRYNIPAGQAVMIPKTEWSEYHLKLAKESGVITIKII